MRLYTVKYGDKEEVAVEIRKGKMCLLSSVGIAVRDMNDLICRYDELKDAVMPLVKDAMPGYRRMKEYINK